MSSTQDIGTEAAKATPPVIVSGLSFLGHSFNDWVAPLTIVYILLQIFFLCRKNWHERKARRTTARKRPLPIDLPDEMPDGK